MPEKTFFKTIEFWNLTVLIIGGSICYFTLSLPLGKLDAKLKGMEIDLKEILNSLEVGQRKIDFVSSATNLTNDVIPKSIITPMTPSVRGNELTIFYSIENSGKYGFLVERPKILLTTSEITSQSDTSPALISGADYQLRYDLPIGMVIAGQKSNYNQTIVFKNNKIEKCFLLVTFTCKTDPSIVAAIQATFEELVPSGEEEVVAKSMENLSTRKTVLPSIRIINGIVPDSKKESLIVQQ